MMMRNAVLAFLVVTGLAMPGAFAAGEESSSSSSSSSTRNSETRSSARESRISRDRGQDDAREALRRGQVMPLTTILDLAAKRERGTVLEVELETEDRVLTYRIDLLTESGRRVRMWLNARTGEILKVRNS